jgi:hypothetical protein
VNRDVPFLGAFALLVACGSQNKSTAAVTLATPSSSVTIAPPPATHATSRLCGRTDAPRVPADIAALIAKKNAPPYYEFPAMPPASVEVVEGAAFEMRDPKVREAFENLRLEKLRDALAKWTIAVALGNRDIDVRVGAARTLERMCSLGVAYRPGAASYMIEVARATAVFVPGSEAATLQGIFMHAIADAVNECLETNIAIKDGQDPEGLKAAARAWQKRLCP